MLVSANTKKFLSEKKTVHLMSKMAALPNSPVCINYFLKCISELIGPEICRWSFKCIHFMKNYAHLWAAVKSSTMKCLLNLLQYQTHQSMREYNLQNYMHMWTRALHRKAKWKSRIKTLGLANTGHHPSPTIHFLVTSKFNIFRVS